MLLEPKRNYLKSADVQQDEEVKFMSEGEWSESKKFTNPDGTAKQQFIVKVECGGETKDFTLNATNRNTLIQHFGKDTALWVGKSAKIQLVQQNVAGSLKSVIYLDPIITT